MAKNLLWITFAPVRNHNGIMTSDLASARYRVIIPARFLATRGYQQTFFTTPEEPDIDEYAPHFIKQDVIIFSKSFNIYNEQIADLAKQHGVKIIYDICDNHFESHNLAKHYKNMVSLADTIVVNTSSMAEIIGQHTSRQAVIVPDPYEGEQHAPCFHPDPKDLNLLWFGSHTNLDSLQAMLPEFVPLSRNIPLKLHIVTTPEVGIEQFCEQFNTQELNFQLKFSAWSVEVTQHAIQNTDIVVIPSMSDKRKVVKSPNRLIESLWGGRFVVAYPLPSYQEFSDWAWVNENLPNGITWALQNPTQVVKNIQKGQHHIAQYFSPQRIGSLWEKAIGVNQRQ